MRHNMSWAENEYLLSVEEALYFSRVSQTLSSGFVGRACTQAAQEKWQRADYYLSKFQRHEFPTNPAGDYSQLIEYNER